MPMSTAWNISRTRGVFDGWRSEILNELVSCDLLILPTLTVMGVVIPPEVMRRLQQRVGEFHAAGGRVTVGERLGDARVPFGAGVHRELDLFVESGITPRHALKGSDQRGQRPSDPNGSEPSPADVPPTWRPWP
jgi:hypothetical protein